jgi:hypothetical protein
MGYKAFGVRNNGECWSGLNAMSTYARYGDDSSCLNGIGGVKANDVYLWDRKFIGKFSTIIGFRSK